MSLTSSSRSVPVRRFSTPEIMVSVLIALAPALALKLWFSGGAWLLTMLGGCLFALILEALALRLRGRDVGFHLQDGSVLVTALLLSLILPASAPWWLLAAGVSIAVIPGKHLFGGLGQNLFNPVALAYLGLLALFPGVLAAKSAELLAGHGALSGLASAMNMALLAGGLYLLLRRIISWHIPATVLLTTGLLVYVFDMALTGSWAILLAFFLATDPVTSPGTRRGKLVFGVFIGLTTMIMTLWLDYPAAVAVAILIMNAAVPAIDQLIKRDGKRRTEQETQQ